MISRFHFPGVLPVRGETPLPEAVAHHAVRVLRLRDGEAVVLFDGSGAEAQATLALRGKAAFARIDDYREVDRESPLQLVLVQALATGDKMDWIVQKAVELGAVAVQPIQAERSVLRLAGERAAKRREHWQQVAVGACEQSGRNRIPEIGEILSLAAYLASAREDAATTRCVLDPQAGSGLAALAQPAGPLHLLVGPEGGWSDEELAACRAAGCIGVGLGPRVLRTETAGLAMLAALQARWGDF